MDQTVLIVDDSGFMRRVLRNTLEEHMNVIGEEGNGAEAVKTYKEQEPDLVMMDVVMPDVDGIEATDAITKFDNDATVVMCTSVGQEEKMRYAAQVGAEGYITKPFDEENVIEAIEQVIDL
jgi:two-component system chemotaxis response regulator CheY